MLTKRKTGLSIIENSIEKLKSSVQFQSQESKNVNITIKLEAYQDIQIESPVCDIQTECIYNSQSLGETPLIPITDNGLLTAEHTFTFQIDTSSVVELDTLLSTPVILKIYLSPGVFDADLYQQLMVNPEFSSKKAKSFDSSVSIYEALVESKISETPEEPEPARKKSTKEKIKAERAKKIAAPEEKTKRQSSISGGSRSSIFELEAYVNSFRQKMPKSLFGQCVVDFLPFFYGQSSFEETLLVKKVENYKDDRMSTYKMHPKIMISVTISKPLNVQNSLLMNFSIESIFNIPTPLCEDWECQVCWTLPFSEDSFHEPILLDKTILTDEKVQKKYKSWPSLSKDDCCPTKYLQDIVTDDIKSKMIDNIQTYFEGEYVRVQFDVIKRNFFLLDGKTSIGEMIKLYKKIILEIFLFPKVKRRRHSLLEKRPSNKSTLDFDSKTSSHYMAIVDVSELLYPGARRTRVAAPVRTFCLEEAKHICGLMESHKSNLNKDESNKLNEAKYENLDREKKYLDNQDKAKKNIRASRAARKSFKSVESVVLENTSKKNSAGDENGETISSSVPIFNERGDPCFIVVELELSEPLIKRHDTIDLSDRLGELLKKMPDDKPKIVLTPTLAKDYYTEVLTEIILDMNEKFFSFLQENPKYKSKTDKTQIEFIMFLQKTGAYRLYLNSITRAISLVATTETRFQRFSDKDQVSQTFLGEIFCYLVSKMHETVNRMICNQLEPISKQVENLKLLYVYAKEATELELIEIADRYLLERLSEDENNPDYWFDYAVFFLEQQDGDRALECVKTSLLKNPLHRYSLLLFGILLDGKQLKEDAETAFLNLLANESKWAEGWGVLYLFYQKQNNFISTDWALDMGKKFLNNCASEDYFSKFKDLAWSTAKYPNTVFFRTAILLIKMRLLDWAEEACAEELNSNTAYAHELLGVIFYYKKIYSHALTHLEPIRYGQTVDCSIIALLGHCLYRLGKNEAAKKEYEFITKSEECSEEFSLVYHNCAKIVEEMGQSQEARKLILLACKYKPTPLTWLIAGRLYYEQNDFLSAEECLSIGNALDNRNGDIWGYLVLVNLKLSRVNEGELCYEQAMKNNVQDNENLYNQMLEEKRKHSILN